MAYTHSSLTDTQLAVAVSVANADPLAGARLFQGYARVKLRAIWAVITTQIATATLTLTYKFRPTPGSAAGEIIIGTLTIPVGALVGKSYYKDMALLDIPCNPGGEVVVQAAGGATGNATVGVSVEVTPENPDNHPNMILSA